MTNDQPSAVTKEMVTRFLKYMPAQAVEAMQEALNSLREIRPPRLISQGLAIRKLEAALALHAAPAVAVEPISKPTYQGFPRVLKDKDLPNHPEPMSYCWSDLEKRAILKWANNLIRKDLPTGWQNWNGDYEKQSYDVWVKGCDVVMGCWPNAGKMVAVDGSNRSWTPEEVLAVRVSDFQGKFPKPPTPPQGEPS